MLENYETVAERLARWMNNLEQQSLHGRVITQMMSTPGADICVFRAELWVTPIGSWGEDLQGTLISTGWAEEVRGQGNVNKTSHVENCETSAIGRALANAGVAGSDPARRASREEMAKVERGASTSGTPFTGTKTITNKMKGKCIHCGNTVDVGEGIATNNGSGWKTSHIEGQCPPEAF